ncbi:MAG: hypothetical protein JXL80_10990, partial [Planctomycetes bacterium]|nr:hypothetical protein [Planctomycetota bacterium]
MMKSAENKQMAQEVIDRITDYGAANAEYYDLAQKRIAAGKIRSAASEKVRDAIKAVLAAQHAVIDKLAKDTPDGKVTDYQKVQNTFLAQETRNAFNRARIWAQKYQIAVDPAEQDTIAKEWVGEIEATRKGLEACKGVFKDPEALKHLNNAVAGLDDYLAQVQTFREINRDQRNVQLNKMKPAADAVLTQGRSVRDGVYKYIADVKEGADAAIALANTLILAVGIGAIALGVVAAFLITVGITKVLKRIIESLTDGAEQTAAASGQVSASSQSLAEGSSEQAASLEETSSSIEEMSSMTKQNAANAKE